MASPIRSNARGASTRERILSAAVGCLADGGIDELRIAKVARRAAVSTGLVHYHFTTREALLAEALTRCFAIAGDARANVKYGDGPALQRLRRKVEESLPHPGRRRREWELWVELWLRAAREPELRTVAAEVYRHLHASTRGLIQEGVDAGEFTVDDPGPVADRLLAAIDGFGLRALLDEASMPVQRAADETWAVLVRELRIPPAQQSH
jgi:AcrR family transcriptional regulator